MKKICLFISLAAALLACESKRTSPALSDTPVSGTIRISAEEAFRPVIEEQVAVYQQAWPDAHINVSYKSEADCLKDFFRDSSVRMAIVTRGLSNKEAKYLADSMGYQPAWRAVAADAVAVIVSAEAPDSAFTLDQLKNMMSGVAKTDKIFVFDGLNRTANVAFIEDSIMKGAKLDTAVVRAVKSSTEVLNYVATHPNAVGFTGINRIGNPEDEQQVAMLKTIRIARIRCDACVNKPYIYPAQQTIMTREYPLVRGLFYLLKENHKGLGSGFSAFLRYERGQLIFRRAYLAPMMNFNVRDVRINEALPED